MRPNRGARRNSNSSSTRERPPGSYAFEQVASPSGSRPSRLSPSGVSVLDRELVTEEDLTLFDNLQISSPDPNPRSFPYSVKQQCWNNAEKVKGRDPDRWRRDALGNIVFRKLVGCPGCLCHDYDHIIPYSKVLNCFISPLSVFSPGLEFGASCAIISAFLFIAMWVWLLFLYRDWGGRAHWKTAKFYRK
ncbi:unnamed protein product [Thlaspi arvense]|uniref:Uncharacterized protein n=1 Tax=Thlaspi arvense TaxID=13288 RepID=A0AAU9RIA1_THLAR|nr:unnamed protein product [Thlaspi arvense]